MALLVGTGLGLVAQQLHHPGVEHGGLDRLRHGVGGQEQTLIEQAVVAQGGAALPTDAGDGEPFGGCFHQVVTACQVAAGGG